MQTQAEIDSFTLNDSLTDTQKILYLVAKGSHAQQLSAVEHFRRLVGYRAPLLPEAALRDAIDAFIVSNLEYYFITASLSLIG